MPYELSDIYIGDFPITQRFGDDYPTYHALYGLSGHNGIDIGCPTNTLVLSAADGVVLKVGSRPLNTFDSGGFGNYVEVLHAGYKTIYAHLNDGINVNVGQSVVKGQLIGHSNNSGNSTAPHLHFGVAPADASGNFTEKSNGFGGWIDPQGERCHWTITNPSAPINPDATPSTPPIPVPSRDFIIMNTLSTGAKTIESYLLTQGINDWLTNNQLNPIDLSNHLDDAKAGDNVVKFLMYKFGKIHDLENKLSLQNVVAINPAINEQDLTTEVNTLVEQQKTGFFSSLKTYLQNHGVLEK